MGVCTKRHPDPERALSRRNQVLAAAECCFSRSGFHGASMAEISKAAGMSAGHIYNYFASKDDIIAAFVENNMEHVSEIIRELDESGDPLQAMLDDLEGTVRHKFDPASWKLLTEIHAEASRNPKIAQLLQDGDRHTHAQFRTIIKRGRAQRGLATDDALLDGRLELISAMFQGMHLRVLHNPTLDPTALSAALRLALGQLLFGE